MNFNGRNKGYESRGGHATAKKRKVNYNTEYDNCACGTKKFPTQYVCNGCLNVFTNTEPTPLKMSAVPEVDAIGKSCRNCDHNLDCGDLVVKGWPVKCEIWDELDVTLLAPNSIS
jgi:hypothetical protein